MRIVTTFSGSNPGSTAVSFAKLRIMRPAPTSSVSASATSATTSADRNRRGRREAQSAARVRERADEIRGRATNRRDEAEDDARHDREQRGERQHATIDGHRDRSAESSWAATPRAARSSTRRAGHPSAPPMSDSSRLSVSSCWTMRRRSAPSAARSAISCCRRSATREHQVREIGAADQEDEANGAEQNESVGRMFSTICS